MDDQEYIPGERHIQYPIVNVDLKPGIDNSFNTVSI